MVLLDHIVTDGFDYGLRFAHHIPGLKDILPRGRSYCGVKDSPLYRMWRIPGPAIDQDPEAFWRAIQAQAGQSAAGPADEFLTRLSQARAQPRPELFLSTMQFEVLETDEGALLRSPYHARVRSALIQMGARWQPELKAWKLTDDPVELQVSTLTQMLRLSASQIVVRDGTYDLVQSSSAGGALAARGALRPNGEDTAAVPDRVPRRPLPVANEPAGSPEDAESEAGDERVEKEKVPQRRRKKSSGGPPSEKVASSDRAMSLLPRTLPRRKTKFHPEALQQAIAAYSLRPYQVTGVQHLLGHTSALLADDMGLGKTRQAVVAARIASGTDRILVICPASLVFNWIDEIRAVAPDDDIALRCDDPAAKWTVCNYEIVSSVIPPSRAFKVAIVDEAHRIKEVEAGQTRSAYEVAKNIEFRMLLTGTPFLNRYTELRTLLKFSGHPLAELPAREFCAALMPQSRDQGQFNSLADWMLRREKLDHLKDLPAKQRFKVPVELVPLRRAGYNKVLNDRSLTGLQRLGQLRLGLEWYKAETVILPWIESMDAADKMIVFCEYQRTVDTLLAKLEDLGIGAVSISGKVSLVKRKKALDQFQGEAECRVFVGTTAAAGVGLNITAANIVCFASLPWTAGLKDQAEDRAWRGGQLRAVEVRIPIVRDTIDEHVYDLVQSKADMSTELNAAVRAARVVMERAQLPIAA